MTNSKSVTSNINAEDLDNLLTMIKDPVADKEYEVMRLKITMQLTREMKLLRDEGILLVRAYQICKI